MKKITAIKNAKVVHERGIIYDGVILICDGRILNYGKASETEIPEDAEVIDALGAYVGPGFVDIHVHGGDGHSSTYDTVEACDFFLSHGTTTLLATTAYNMDFDTFIGGIKSAREAKSHARTMRGLYLEGPYTNANYGSHSYLNSWRGDIIPEQFKALVDAAGEDAVVWTIAPERANEGLIPFLEYARKVNPSVRFSLGHSEALPREIRALGKYKPTIQTHSMNATGRVGEPKGGLRCVGPDEYAFREPDMFCELISDSLGIHVDPELQQMLIHIKGVHKVCLITDSTVHRNSVPEEFAHVTDLNFDARGGIAGSRLTMDAACRNVMSHTSCGICEAFLMASTNPAKAVGFYDELGSIDIGKRADLVFVDDVFNVKRVILGGETVV